MEFDIVIGFEVHTELKTRSKIWCGCSTEFGNPPNTQVCPICLGMPGTLPVLNREAFHLALRATMAMHCEIPPVMTFDRKNYYYPDIPKNYQISQNENFIGRNGYIEIAIGNGDTKQIGIDNIHLEEDAGKNIHPEDPGAVHSLVDLNRAGMPLLEIVTKPDIRSREEAQAFMTGMRQLLQYLGISDCKMQEGSLRFELNMSLRPKGSDSFGQKVEVKNLNSMATVMKCIDAEWHRQSEILSEGGRVLSETRLWDDVADETRAMRTKEEANDYRYFPDPDLVDITISPELREHTANELPELPLARRQRFEGEYGLSSYDAARMTDHIATANYFETAVSLHNSPKGIANWIMGEALAWLNKQPEDTTIDDFPVPPEAIAELVRMIESEEITGKIAKQVFPVMLDTGKQPSVIVEEQGLKPLAGDDLEPIIDEVIAANAKAVEDLRAGKQKAMGALMGQIMRKTQGKANPAVVTPIVMKKLGIE